MPEKYTINGVAVTKYGPAQATDKPPIIMVHGGTHAGWCWEHWATFFSEAGYEVHVPDWYNHGDSEALPEEEFIHRSIADVAAKEISFVAEKLSRAPILIGHSMGGLASAVYATQSPVERLVLLTPVIPQAIHPEPLPLPIDMSKPYPVFPYEQAKHFFFPTSSDNDAKRYYDRLGMESPTAVHEATRWDVDVDISKIRVPVMVVAVEFDYLIPFEPLKRYAGMLHADFKMIKGIGHSDILLKSPEWEAAATDVRTWLQK
jgi:pimeloyl-ACP methyl ester carboxylesterase